MKALCLPGAVGELFHPFALCWLFPGAQGAQLHNSSPLWWSQSPSRAGTLWSCLCTTHLNFLHLDL